ncbi:chromo (CHRromatin organization MOdifier) domain domain-containing protein [Purpureocillium lilacinum]|uniref:Chromo (CHRromatin organization MOdifier) domain domain-containing protein n=1 Tax=Purpureocillium lilacinum TaxID=33203 RepID=A0A179FEG4_PURLI|nr:chromo (CHRromatin organization MOdifier) domain domain-containing protein [Purpureocillium lilacinum]
MDGVWLSLPKRKALLNELEAELLAYSPQELVRIANEQFRWCDAGMRRALRELDSDDWKRPWMNLHEDAPGALLGYWQEKGGRPVNPKDPDMFDILAVRNHSADRKRLLVEWVGFGPEDATWVSRRSVEHTAPSAVAQYMEKVTEKQAKGMAKARVVSGTLRHQQRPRQARGTGPNKSGSQGQLRKGSQE